MHDSTCVSFGKLIGRLLISAIFIIAGIHKIFDYEATSVYMASKGLPLIPLLLILSACVELFGGFSLLLGYKIRFAAFILILFLILVTSIFHDFWALSGADRGLQINEFLKNLGILGGLFYILSTGAGRFGIHRSSIDP